MGIMGFAFVSILGLMPVGLTSFRETKNVSVASLIAQQIFGEVQSTTFAELIGPTQPGNSWQLPPPGSQTTATTSRCFNEQGQEVSPTDPTAQASVVYRVNVRVAASTPYVQNGVNTPTQNAALANVAIQVAYNPGNLTMDTTNSYWTGKSNGITVPMYTYETLVARNF